MFPDRKDMSRQINSAIKKKWCKECSVILDQLVVPENTETLNIAIEQNYPIQNASAVTINRLKERIEALEDLNDHLYYYVCFLVENLPELIIKTMQSSFDFNNTIECTNERVYSNGSEKAYFGNQFGFPFPTRRESDVLELLEKGYCAKEIATKLFISETTVITHKKNLKKKFNAKNIAELISKLRSAKK